MEFLDKLIECFSTKEKHKSLSKVEAKTALDKVYGFEKQKQELTQFLSAQNYLNSQASSNTLSNKILCLVGPPGIGKTAFAQAIAEILGKKFYLIPLAARAEPLILIGDLPSFKGASCGQIVEAIIKTKSTSPVILLDEVDKASDKSSRAGGEIPGIRQVLLQILDPLQNKNFKDQYLDVQIDLSQITFVLTANNIDDLDPALKSRLEIIQLEGYSPQDKKHIAKLILDELFAQTNYLNYNQLEITDSA
jgi:ATP-dependent Lon protease